MRTLDLTFLYINITSSLKASNYSYYMSKYVPDWVKSFINYKLSTSVHSTRIALYITSWHLQSACIDVHSPSASCDGYLPAIDNHPFTYTHSAFD